MELFKIFKNLFKFLFIILTISFMRLPVEAVEFYFKSSQNSYYPNEIFNLELHLNPSSENITAVELKVKYIPQDLKAIGFINSNSLLMMIEPPEIREDQGLITFSGIIPGGFKGRVPGDPGESNLLGTIVFQVLKTKNQKTKVSVLEDSKIFIEDGQELSGGFISNDIEINIYPKEVVFNPLNELDSLKESDKTPPEEFKAEIIKINDNYFLIFETKDKQSGVESYNLLVGEKKCFGKIKKIKEINNISSPYQIEEKDLNKIIRITAIDKAGNQRSFTIFPQKEPFICFFYQFGIIILLITAILILYFLRWRKLTH